MSPGATVSRGRFSGRSDTDETEAWAAPQNEAFVARLEELGIPVTFETGPGTHTWPYWQQGLHHALPLLLDALEE